MTAAVYGPDVTVEVGWDSGVNTPLASVTWTDVSAKVEFDQTIAINRGRADERATTSPSSCSLVLDNSDGRFTPGLASSPYYPNVKLGRPVRVAARVPGAVGNFLSANNASFETSVAGWTAGGSVPPVLTRSTVRAQSGSASMLITWGAAGVLPRASTTVTGLVVGRQYTASAYGYVPTGDPNIVLNVVGIGFGSGMSTKNAFTRFSFTFTATASSHVLEVWPSSAPAATDQCWIDAVQVWEGSAVATFTTTAADTVISTRFTGYIDEWPVDWSDGVDSTAYARITASSRLARVSEGAELRSIIESEIMADNPVRYYPMGESEEIGHCNDLTAGDSIGMYSYYGGDGINLGAATGPSTDGLSAPEIEPFTGTETQTSLAAWFTPTMSTCTVECFVRIPAKNVDDIVAVISLYQGFGSDDYRLLQLRGVSIDITGGTSSTFDAGYSERVAGSTSSIGATTVYADPATAIATWDSMFAGRTHHVAMTFQPGASPTLKTYIDGDLFNTKTDLSGAGPLMTTMPQWELLVLGPYEVDSGTRPMVVAHAAVFDTILADDRIKAHADAGLNGFVDEMAADRITRYATYAGLETADIDSDTGVVPLGHIDTTGKTVESLLRTIEATENGVLYDGRDGSLVFQAGNHRYQAASAFTLNAAAQEVGASLRPVLDGSNLVNEVTAKSAANSSLEQRYSDTTSRDDYGPRRADIEIASSDMDRLYQSAAWRVNQYKDPLVRVPTLAPVDALLLADATRDAIVAADISTMFTVSNLPAQAPASTAAFFVEGITETLALESWDFQFNVSPAEIFTNTWVLDSVTRSQLGTSTTLAY